MTPKHQVFGSRRTVMRAFIAAEAHLNHVSMAANIPKAVVLSNLSATELYKGNQ